MVYLRFVDNKVIFVDRSAFGKDVKWMETAGVTWSAAPKAVSDAGVHSYSRAVFCLLRCCLLSCLPLPVLLLVFAKHQAAAIGKWQHLLVPLFRLCPCGKLPGAKMTTAVGKLHTDKPMHLLGAGFQPIDSASSFVSRFEGSTPHGAHGANAHQVHLFNSLRAFA